MPDSGTPTLVLPAGMVNDGMAPREVELMERRTKCQVAPM